MISTILNNFINNKYFLFLTAITILFKNFFFPGWWLEIYGIDQWLYWGSAQNLEYYKSHFSDTYYFRRWISIFPFYIFQKIFTPGNTWYFLSNLSLFVTLYTFLKIVFRFTNDHYIGFFSALFIIFNSYISQRISSAHVTMIALPLFLILFEYCLNILNKNQFRTKEIFFFFISAGLLLITFQGYLKLIFIFYLIFLIRIFNNNKLKGIYKFHLILFFSLLTVIFFDYIIGQLTGAKWENIITYSLKVAISLNQHPIWGARDNFKFELPYGSLFYATISSLIILILKKKIENDYKINFVYLYNLLIIILFYLPELVSFNKISFHKHSFILIYISSLINTIFLFRYLNIFLKFLTLIIILVLHFFLLKYNLNIENLSKLFTLSLFIVLSLYFLKINILNYKNVSIILIIFSLTLSLLEISNKGRVRLKSSSWADQQYKIRFLNELSADVKEITKYNSSYRIWLLDRRDHINNNYLARSLYYQYSQLDPKEVSICKQLEWMSLFDNSVLLILGFEESNRALFELKKLTINCSIKKIIKLNLKYKDAFAFKILN